MKYPIATDVAEHNAEAKAVWEAYRAGKPTRVPVMVSTNERCTLKDPIYNPRGLQYDQVFADPQLMLERQLEHQMWLRSQPWQDAEMGMPEKAWDTSPNFLNIYEAAWYGCPIVFITSQIPDSEPILSDEDSKRRLFDQGIPDPFNSPFARQTWAAYEHFLARRQEGWTWQGLPLGAIHPPLCGTDGPVTVACNLRGATEFLEDLACDPDYAEELMAYITEATITRIRAINDRVGHPQRWGSFWFADDSIQLISTQMYVDQVLPHHKKLVDAFSDGSPGGIHLCGNATRHFPTIRDELNVKAFDTGFPVDHGQLRRDLGQDVEIFGGPSVPFLCQATPDEVREETKRILQSGVMEGGRFVLREGNNLAPGTPCENLVAMHQTAREFGVY